MAIQKTAFGRFWNTDVNCFTLKSQGGVTAKILDYGAIIQSLTAPGKTKSADIILGFDTLYDYLKGHPFFGAIAGRVANRIPDGHFSIDDHEYQLNVNAPYDNHLHGGFRGFDKYVWDSEIFEEGDTMVLRLHRISQDGEENYPGNLDTTITYTLNADNVLTFEVTATTDKPTIVNIVQHSYFNMAGHDSGNVCDQELAILSDQVTPTDDRLCPTGDIMDVETSPFDFRSPQKLGQAFEKMDGIFDINYALKPSSDGLSPCAQFHDPVSGRTMAMATTLPGLQFYNGHKIYEQDNNFPSMVIRPDQTYHHKTTYAFSIE